MATALVGVIAASPSSDVMPASPSSDVASRQVRVFAFRVWVGSWEGLGKYWSQGSGLGVGSKSGVGLVFHQGAKVTPIPPLRCPDGCMQCEALKLHFNRKEDFVMPPLLGVFKSSLAMRLGLGLHLELELEVHTLH